MRRIIVAAGIVALCAQSLHAQLYFSRDSLSELYSLDPATGAAKLVGTTGTTASTVGLTETNDPNILYSTTWFQLARINIAAGTHTILGTIPGGAEGLAWDPTTSVLYGYINNNFFTIDPMTPGLTSPLAGTPAEVEGLAWRTGFVYGLGGTNGNLYRYSIAGNTWSLVGDTGITFPDSTGLAWDPVGDVLYAKSEFDSFLYRINPVTAASSIVGDTGILSGGGLAWVRVPEPTTAALASFAVVLAACRRRQWSPSSAALRGFPPDA
jgi:hypothetical protein